MSLGVPCRVWQRQWKAPVSGVAQWATDLGLDAQILSGTCSWWDTGLWVGCCFHLS